MITVPVDLCSFAFERSIPATWYVRYPKSLVLPCLALLHNTRLSYPSPPILIYLSPSSELRNLRRSCALNVYELGLGWMIFRTSSNVSRLFSFSSSVSSLQQRHKYALHDGARKTCISFSAHSALEATVRGRRRLDTHHPPPLS